MVAWTVPGLQTVVFEVAGAFLVARFAISRGEMKRNDAVAYGLGLAFWGERRLPGTHRAIEHNFLFHSSLARWSGCREYVHSSFDDSTTAILLTSSSVATHRMGFVGEGFIIDGPFIMGVPLCKIRGSTQEKIPVASVTDGFDRLPCSLCSNLDATSF